MDNTITLNELINDINKSINSNEYSFLRVLNKNDRIKYLLKINKNDYKSIFITKKHNLNKWLNIMTRIKLSTNYVIYRKCYFGENTGNNIISTHLTNYITPLYYFSSSENNTTIMEYFYNMIYGLDIINLVLNNNTIEEFDFKSNVYKSAYFTNKDYHITSDFLI